MKYLKATITAYRRTGMNTIHYMMNVFSVIGLILMIFCAFSYSDDAAHTMMIFIGLIGMTVFYSRTEAVNRYGIFYGGKKFESRGLIVFDERPHKALQLMPFSREDAVRSFINFERLTSALIIIAAIVFAVKAFTLTLHTLDVIIGSIIFIISTAGLYVYEKALLTYDINILANRQSFGSVFNTLFLLYIILCEKLTKIEFGMPVLSVIFGALTLVSCIIFIICSEKVHKQLIADCGSRSFTGEPIGGAK